MFYHRVVILWLIFFFKFFVSKYFSTSFVKPNIEIFSHEISHTRDENIDDKLQLLHNVFYRTEFLRNLIDIFDLITTELYILFSAIIRCTVRL